MGICKFSCLEKQSELKSEFRSPMQNLHLSTLRKDKRVQQVYDLQTQFQTTEVGIVRNGTLKGHSSPTFQIRTIYQKKKQTSLQQISNQLTILSQLRHPNIQKIYQIFQHQGVFHIITDPQQGKTLLNLIQQDTLLQYDCKKIIRQILQALQYIHQQGICHRNLKIDNIFVVSDQLDVKIGGFAFAKEFIVDGKQNLMDSIVGLPYFMAPEVLKKGYSEKCDLWSLGVVCYMLLFGQIPFAGNSFKQIHLRATNGRYSIPSNRVSKEAENFLRKLMEFDPEKRYSSKEALEDPWIKITYNQGVQ